MGLRGKQPASGSDRLLGGVKKYRQPGTVTAAGVPKKPRNMPQHAGKLWDDIVPKLIAVGLATELDQTMLEKMCFFYHCFVVTRDAILAGGDYSSTDAVRLVNNNAKFHDNYRRLAVQFGMTPLARGSLTLTEPETDDEFFQS